MALVYAGIALLADVPWALLPLPFVLAVIDRAVIAREERYLERNFGGEDLDYKAHVRRWIRGGAAAPAAPRSRRTTGRRRCRAGRGCAPRTRVARGAAGCSRSPPPRPDRRCRPRAPAAPSRSGRARSARDEPAR